MSSLKNRILISFSASLIIFLVIFAITIFFGFNLSLKDWNRANEEKLVSGITKTLEKLYRNGNPDKNLISEKLSPYIRDNMEISVFNHDGRILFSHNRKNDEKQEFPNENIMLMMKNSFPMMQGRGMMQHMGKRPPPMGTDNYRNLFPGQAVIRPVIADNQIKAFVKVKSLRFKFYSRVNKRFINSILITVITGTLAAFAIAVFSSWFISKKLTRDAAFLSEGLNRLAGGMRNVIFPYKGSEEILSISESASILQEELIHDEERRKQWAQDIAHDLRTPITAVKAQVEALKDGIFKPDSERFAKLLMELRRLETLVEDMNSLSRIESSNNVLRLSNVNSEDIKEILKERFEAIADDRKISLIFNSESFMLSCDINLLLRALSNLVQNSIKYSDEQTDVNINIFKTENKAVFSVENRGYIEESEIEKIFDRLYRGESGRSSEGTGLGLTIASAIIKQHNGEIKAENSKDSIVFTAILPITHIDR